jgi:hypothetical protein
MEGKLRKSPKTGDMSNGQAMASTNRRDTLILVGKPPRQ